MKENQSPIVVSIICDAFNHEPYIRKCLDGFIMQQTSFPFEVLIHDDASTDSTAEIIREYAGKYPDIIKPILQTENKYSQGISIWCTYQFPRAQGKYIAFCEGDDYWTDPLKLQKQVDLMEANPHISLCCHHYSCLDIRTGIEDDSFILCPEGEYRTKDLVRGNFIQTLTVMIRNDRQVFDTYRQIGSRIIGDYALWFCCSLRGNICKMKDMMATYRLGSGSYSSLSDVKRHVTTLSLLNRFVCFTHDEEARQALEEYIAQIEMLIAENKFSKEGHLVTRSFRRHKIVRDLSLVVLGFWFLLRDLFRTVFPHKHKVR